MEQAKRINLHTLLGMHAAGEKITVLTCYDATFAGILDLAGVDVLLVGDSLGMVLGGMPTTLSVDMATMVYHTSCVARGARRPWLIADMPFGSYHESPAQAFTNAARLIQAGAQMVKVEGGEWVAPTIRFMVERGVPVCAHVGFTPQAVHALGGFRIQGKSDAAVAQLLRDAEAVAGAGAQMLVLELVPSPVTELLTARIGVPVIGIGAGSHCAGQVLVLHDMLGITQGPVPRFVRNFLVGATSIQEAVANYVAAVKTRQFPDDTTHGY